MDDLVDMYRDVFRATIRQQPVRRGVRIGIAVAMLAGVAWVLNRDGGTAGDVFYGAAVGVVMALPVCWSIAWLLLPRRAQRLFAQDRTSDPRWTWRWSEEGLEGSSAHATVHHRWSELHRWHDGKRTLLFFLNDAHVLYIPRNRLTETQGVELRTLADAGGVPRR